MFERTRDYIAESCTLHTLQQRMLFKLSAVTHGEVSAAHQPEEHLNLESLSASCPRKPHMLVPHTWHLKDKSKMPLFASHPNSVPPSVCQQSPHSPSGWFIEEEPRSPLVTAKPIIRTWGHLLAQVLGTKLYVQLGVHFLEPNMIT